MNAQPHPDSKLNFPAEADNIESEQTVSVQTLSIADRQRQITAEIQIPQSVEQVWQILTNYDALSEFIPNLARSRRLKHPTGGIRLEQVGTQRLLRFNFSARVVLDLEEKFPHEIKFDMVEGDLKSYSGSWLLSPGSTSEQSSTILQYIVRVSPKRTMPVAIIERRLTSDLRLNLLAIRQRAAELFS